MTLRSTILQLMQTHDMHFSASNGSTYRLSLYPRYSDTVGWASSTIKAK